jgi:hypothetical protein
MKIMKETLIALAKSIIIIIIGYALMSLVEMLFRGN